MNINDLRPARDFAIQFGVKSIVFGPPGRGKTPVANTAPRPVLMACEPGLLSMRNSTVPTYPAFDAKKIDEFFQWLMNSKEASNFDTVVIDSISQMAELILWDEVNIKKVSHGLKAYGNMSTRVMTHLNNLYFTRYKHTYLICKMQVQDSVKKPWFPGNELNVKVPHLFDEVLCLDDFVVPGHGTARAFRCTPDVDVVARDRTGRLNEYEPPNLANIFAKCMS